VLPTNKPVLCYVTDRKSLSAAAEDTEDDRALLAAIERVAAAGAHWVQIREKDLPAAQLAALVRSARNRAPSTVRILVNDRLDVALAAGADGIHLGEASLPLEDVHTLLHSAALRGLSSQEFMVGVSTHSVDEARAAEEAGAGYLFFGPVFETPSKAAFGLPQGITRLAEVCRLVRIPVLAIGGITAENAAECLKAGAAGIAAIRMFQETVDLAQLFDLLGELPAGRPRPGS
jgi:thiamine-phosphate pyrophosphorylase